MKDLVPQKRIAAELGISRSSHWRASRSSIPGFPPPIVLRRRVYWREADLPVLKVALERFQGRKAFKKERRHAKARAVLAQTTGLKPKRRKRTAILRQPDLFGGDDVAAPSGAKGGLRRRG